MLITLELALLSKYMKQVQAIQEELARPSTSEEEAAFLEAAEEQLAALSYAHAGNIHSARRY